jgi:glyoxylase-like metal-dependent hydrolase (beta-lactamase superfamily II)
MDVDRALFRLTQLVLLRRQEPRAARLLGWVLGSCLRRSTATGRSGASSRWFAAGHQSFALIGAALLLGAASPALEAPPFAHWIDGTTASEPETQVQRIDDDTFVIRQSVRTNFEAPFLYLLFGKDRALLIDTGAGGLKIRPTIDRLVAAWQAKHGGRPIRLVVAHSHGHGDHHAGDDEFRDRPDTDLVGLKAEEVAAFFRIQHWPDDIARFDLGERILDIIPTPGHEPAHMMVYDARTQLLFSGDMLYPGRLYVPDGKFAEFRASADRLAAFAAKHPIRALLGAHIEMTATPGQDYPMKAETHPSERVLPLSPAAIAELQQAAAKAETPPMIDRHADFIVYPLPPEPPS